VGTPNRATAHPQLPPHINVDELPASARTDEIVALELATNLENIRNSFLAPSLGGGKRDQLQQAAAFLRIQAGEIKKLRQLADAAVTALEPFAKIAMWAEDVAQQDREAKLDNVWVYIHGPGVGGANCIDAEAFYRAQAVLRVGGFRVG
jgi:hypothetical protein